MSRCGVARRTTLRTSSRRCYCCVTGGPRVAGWLRSRAARQSVRSGGGGGGEERRGARRREAKRRGRRGGREREGARRGSEGEVSPVGEPVGEYATRERACERCAVWRGWRQSTAFQEPRGDSVYRTRTEGRQRTVVGETGSAHDPLAGSQLRGAREGRRDGASKYEKAQATPRSGGGTAGRGGSGRGRERERWR